MRYIIPDYYKKYACIADRCEDTCCAGWQIVVDDRSWRRYLHVRGLFGRYVRRALRKKDHTFRQTKDGRCAFLDQNNLCRMYRALGRNSLCRTCRRYPRHVEEFENVREVTLSLSCPEVTRILLDREEPVRFLTYEKEGEETWQDFDPFLYSLLLDGRETIYAILQNRSVPMEARTWMVLRLAGEMQEKVDQKDMFSCQELFEAYRKPEMISKAVAEIEHIRADRMRLFQTSYGLFRGICGFERLKNDWDILLRETEDLLYRRGEAGYIEVGSRFEEWRRNNLKKWDIWMEQLMVYFISTYFCGAVYDGQILSKARMAAGSVWMICEILAGRWVMNAEGLDLEDIKEILYRYSRELEHSDLNLEKMENLRWDLTSCNS